MLLRTSGEVLPGLFQIVLGRSCHYVMVADHGVALFDPGTAAHARMIPLRLQQLRLPASILRIFLTHDHPERVGGSAAALHGHRATLHLPRGIIEGLPVVDFLASRADEAGRMVPAAAVSAVTKDEFTLHPVGEGSVIPWGHGGSVSVFPLPLHTSHSCAYFIQPQRALIVDEGFGYYSGRSPAALGADFDAAALRATIDRFIELDIRALCLPFGGTLTGNLIRKHFDEVAEAWSEISTEVAEARREQVPAEEIRAQLFEHYYEPLDDDHALIVSRDRSFHALCAQLGL